MVLAKSERIVPLISSEDKKSLIAKAETEWKQFIGGGASAAGFEVVELEGGDFELHLGPATVSTDQISKLGKEDIVVPFARRTAKQLTEFIAGLGAKEGDVTKELQAFHKACEDVPLLQKAIDALSAEGNLHLGKTFGDVRVSDLTMYVGPLMATLDQIKECAHGRDMHLPIPKTTLSDVMNFLKSVIGDTGVLKSKVDGFKEIEAFIDACNRNKLISKLVHSLGMSANATINGKNKTIALSDVTFYFGPLEITLEQVKNIRTTAIPIPFGPIGYSEVSQFVSDFVSSVGKSPSSVLGKVQDFRRACASVPLLSSAISCCAISGVIELGVKMGWLC